MKIRIIALFGAIALAVPALAQDMGMAQSIPDEPNGLRPVPINATWVVRKADNYPDKRIYRRYSFTQEMDLPNVMMLTCPRDRGNMVHMSFEMRRIGDLKRVFPSGFDDFEARFLVGGSSFSLKGEVIETELFFDRTPERWQEFDKVLNSDEFRLRFSGTEGKVTVIYKVIPEFTKALPEILQTVKAGSAAFYTTDQAMRECRKFRGEV
jgi:hypothetical protein